VTVAGHIPPADELAGAGWWLSRMTPDDELEDIELGERVSIWFTNWMTIYSSEADRIRQATGVMVASVASATSRRSELDPQVPDLPFPAEWWPPSVAREKQ
jgi:hypothetical protein